MGDETKEIEQLLLDNTKKNVAIIAHDNPDADAIGSMVALEELLKQCGKKVTYIAQSKIKTKYKLLVGKKRVNKLLLPREFFDILFVVDCSAKSRIRVNLDEYSDEIVVIDHHIDFPKYGDIYWCEDVIANTILIYKLILYLQNRIENVKMTDKIATAIYLGIVSDSFNFRSNGVTKDVHKIASELLEYNVDLQFVNDVDALPRSITNLASEILKNIMYDSEYKIMYVNIMKSTIDSTFSTYEDASKIIDLLRNFRDVDVAVVFVTNKYNTYIKVRSRSLDVSKIMKEFCGGGHKCAAGAVCYSDDGMWLINSVIRKIKEEIDADRIRKSK